MNSYDSAKKDLGALIMMAVMGVVLILVWNILVAIFLRHFGWPFQRYNISSILHMWMCTFLLMSPLMFIDKSVGFAIVIGGFLAICGLCMLRRKI